MPYKRKYAPRRRFRRKKPTGFATRPRWMPKTLARKRFNQVATKVFWFKDNGDIKNNAGGFYQTNWTTQQIVANPPTGFTDLVKLYDEFKVIGMYVKLFPANVGIEPDTALFSNNGTLRGDVIVWSDQKADVTPSTIASVSDKINQASCRMINPRRPYSRKIFRPTGNPNWGGTSSISQQPDQWIGQISVFGQNTTTVTPPALAVTLWYWTRAYKVIVRGRINE